MRSHPIGSVERDDVRESVGEQEGGQPIAPWDCPLNPGIQNAPGKAPPSRSRFCPVMYPAWAEQRKAQAAPNSAGSPKRRAGIAC